MFLKWLPQDSAPPAPDPEHLPESVHKPFAGCREVCLQPPVELVAHALVLPLKVRVFVVERQGGEFPLVGAEGDGE